MGTLYHKDDAGTWQDYGLVSRPNKSYHSHPEIATTETFERYSMVNDYFNMKNFPHTKAPLYYVYFPESNNVYQLTSSYANKLELSIYQLLGIPVPKR